MNPRRPLRVALTGGIATGKTHCRRRFESHGLPTIDADRLARNAVEPGTPALQAIAAHFGPAALDDVGRLDRRALAKMVFGQPEELRFLESVVHPVVYDAIARWFETLEVRGEPIGVADIPLLYETGRAADFDRVVVAACTPEQQLSRLMTRDGLAEGDAHQRIASQWPLDRKVHAADFVIDTSGSLEETDRQVADVVQALTALSAGARRDPLPPEGCS